MEKLLLLLAFPIVWPFIAKRIWHDDINWTEMVIQICLVAALTAGVWQLGMFSAQSDTEIWNGQVVEKYIHDDHYVESYECNCTGSGSSRTCSTCYEDHYTRDWIAKTTVGKITFDRVDYTSRMWRDNAKSPTEYVRCEVGSPASREMPYVNYVQAVPDSLFYDATAGNSYDELVPAYPHVYEFYRIQRVVADKPFQYLIPEINPGLNEALIELGYDKQVNISVVLTDVDDRNFRYAVERVWEGANKNDVVIVVGLDVGAEHMSQEKITWADAFTWANGTGNELMNIKLRDEIQALGTLDPVAFNNLVVSNIRSSFVRPQMKDYEYLKDAIEPAGWVIIFAIIIAIGGSIGLTFVFRQVHIDDYIGELFTGRRSQRRVGGHYLHGGPRMRTRFHGRKRLF